MTLPRPPPEPSFSHFGSGSLTTGHMQEPLTQRLRIASKKEHRISDSLVAARLLVTATDKRRWALALTAFWHILAAVEKALQTYLSDAGFSELTRILAKVNRSGAFERDLHTFYGPSWREKVPPPSSAVHTYLERVEMLAADSPVLLVVHAYTQHMAFLAGGQVLRRSVRGALQLGPDDPGTAIFEFQEPVTQLKEEYKSILNRLEGQLGEQRTNELIEEHRLVFQLNNAVIREFPVSPGSVARGLVKLLPPEVLLLLVSALLALLLVLYTRRWIVTDPDAAQFADPDALINA